MGISVAGGMNIQPGKESLSMPVVPNWLVSIQCFLFITLYSVWILPKTLALRNSCLGLGALIGLYLIVKFRTQFLSYKALGLYFLVALFLWTTFHLFFLSVDFELQLMEYQSTWKRTLLGSLFAIGLGLSLTTNKKKWVWPVFYFGLLTPSLIYIFKFSYAHWAPLWLCFPTLGA